MTSKTLFTSLVLSSFVIMLSSININTYTILPMKAPFEALTPDTKKQISCLAENIYFEAAHEPHEGKIAVAFVTLNRLMTGNYADTICEVVTQKIKGICQFSWYCDQKIVKQRSTIHNTQLYIEILNLSTYVYLNLHRLKDITNGATYYHADYVNPKWNLKKETKIGRHIFYTRNGDEIDRNKRII